MRKGCKAKVVFRGALKYGFYFDFIEDKSSGTPHIKSLTIGLIEDDIIKEAYS